MDNYEPHLVEEAPDLNRAVEDIEDLNDALAYYDMTS